MDADDHIRRTFDTLAERLRDEISRQLDEFSGPLAAELDRERADVNTRLATALAEAARLRADLADAESRLAAAVADADARVAEAVAETEDRVADAVASAESRHAEALSTADARRAEALAEADARLAEALAKADHAVPSAIADASRAVALAKADGVADAMRAMDRAGSLSEILDTLANCAAREAGRVGVLLVRGSQLRAWRFIGFGPTLDEATQYEIPVADAGIIGDAMRSGTAVSGDSATLSSVPSFADLPPGREMVALPVPMSGQVVAVLYADQGAASGTTPAVSLPASLDVMCRHAARCLEAVTARRSAQVVTEPPGARSAAAPSPAAAASFSPGSAGFSSAAADDEQAARRYARLLISEIKLYHEADVVAGRRERDLMSRLGGEIARARVLYEQRVPAHIRQSTDCFHDELVRTLADGDRELIA